jgi:hypothetical protein
MHHGIDLVGETDINVYAPCDGVIGASTIVSDKTNRTWEWGNFVRIDTEDKKHSIFLCHLKSRTATVGQKVKKGDKVGVMGCTGFCIPSGVLGTHTHYEVRKYGTYTRVNPADFIGIPNRVGTYTAVEKKMLESGNDIVWQLMNGNPKIVINEPKRAIEALDKARNNPDFMSLYWIIYKVVNGNGG